MAEATENHPRDFAVFAGKVVLVHTVTYFLFGLLMSNLFDYSQVFQQEIIRDFMRPFGSGNVLLGPLVQPLRGLLFALALWPIRRTILEHRRGWLILWGLFLAFGILGTPAAAPSSLEGVIYSKLPLWYHLLGLPEITLQTLAFSLILFWWERRRYPRGQVRERTLGPDLIKAVMIASFAYMAYAVGSILSAVAARVSIDMEAAAADWTMQLMFVVAFAVNVVAILLVSRRKLAWWQVFLVFWLTDALVPLVYQALFTSPMPLPLALWIGFLPAVVITVGIVVGYKGGKAAT